MVAQIPRTSPVARNGRGWLARLHACCPPGVSLTARCSRRTIEWGRDLVGAGGKFAAVGPATTSMGWNMRRTCETAVTVALLLVAGCGGRSYELRLNRTIEYMKYQKKLDQFLGPAPTQGRWSALSIYVRPPKPLTESKEFQLTVVEPGQYDLAASFVEPQKKGLHVLARKKQPKDAAKKKAPTAADTAVRGDFNGDVITLINSVYGVELQKGDKKKQEEKKRDNTFQHQFFNVPDGTKTVHLFLYKNDPYDVALVFRIPARRTGEHDHPDEPLPGVVRRRQEGRRLGP